MKSDAAVAQGLFAAQGILAGIAEAQRDWPEAVTAVSAPLAAVFRDLANLAVLLDTNIKTLKAAAEEGGSRTLPSGHAKTLPASPEGTRRARDARAREVTTRRGAPSWQ
jgi:hypothetical protein